MVKQSKTGLDLDARFLLNAAALAVGVRLGLLLIALIAGRVVLESTSGNIEMISGMLNRWDAPHFLRLAEVGYQSTGEDRLFLVFFPLYPLAVCAVNYLVNDLLASGIIVSLIFSVLAGFYLQKLVYLELGLDESSRVIWLFYLFPTAYFLALPYTEAIFLATSTASFYYARLGSWRNAGIAGFLAVLARVHGLALLPALAVEAFLQSRFDRKPNYLKYAWLLLVLAGFVVYLGINEQVGGSPTAFMEIQRNHWHHSIVEPFSFFINNLSRLNADNSFNLIVITAPFAALVFVGLVMLAGFGWLRLSYYAFLLAAVIPSVVDSWPISLPRYVFGFFPVFVVLAWLSRNNLFYKIFLSASAFLMAGLFFIYSMGRWAF